MSNQESVGRLFVNRIFLFLCIALVSCGCRSLPKQYSAALGRSLVEGVVTEKKPNPKTALFGVLLAPPDSYEPISTTRVEIANVDGNPLPESTAFYVANKVWLKSGVHRLTVCCITDYPEAPHETLTSGTNIEINIQSGYNYYIKSKPLEIVAVNPIVISKPELEVTTKKTTK